MEAVKTKRVLISGASIAGLSTAYWMLKLGYNVTVVELANELRLGGTAVDIRGSALDVVKRMGIIDQLRSKRLTLELIEFKNNQDVTEGSMQVYREATSAVTEEIEIERSELVTILFNTVKNNIEFSFNNSIVALSETEDDINVTFKDGSHYAFDLVIGCDGTHSGVRKIWFGDEKEYNHFLDAYFSISIINKLLIKPNTLQFYNVPGKAYMLNAYKNKTDIVFCFSSEGEIEYNYQDIEQQRKIILNQFAGKGWRTNELGEEVKNSKNFYFDKFCQIKMPSWTKGRVALVGDAAYCASPAAGIGGSLAMEGAATLGEALQKHDGNFDLACQDYNSNLRPFIDEVQAEAVLMLREQLIPRTEEAIRKRNTQSEPW